MRVVTKLARMEFTIGGLAREGDDLVITSGGDERAMKVKAYIQPGDVIAFLRVALRPAIIRYVFGLPLLLWRRRQGAQGSHSTDRRAGWRRR
ncbi:hypothetical protein [Actinocrispum wychmicini]|uniref:Uncharacterized protein n=1 Tax=Actinocrispum wychmicini TaxID=1213861 RepID=A0A4R2JQM0_9PSEU|nr:hypothetical protein [Actinocrispum wychmicini]TCO61112.1 hypothetical protein EV192_103696 [Actinocrispum wychmicini]